MRICGRRNDADEEMRDEETLDEYFDRIPFRVVEWVLCGVVVVHVVLGIVRIVREYWHCLMSICKNNLVCLSVLSTVGCVQDAYN